MAGIKRCLHSVSMNFFDVIDNQRYILVKRKNRKGLNGFYAIPNCFSKKKEDAERFANACIRISETMTAYIQEMKRKRASVRRQS